MSVSSLQQKGRDQWSTMGPLSISLSPGVALFASFSVEYGNEIFAQDCTKLVAYFDYAAPGGTDFLGSSLTVSGAISGPPVAHSLGDKVDIKMGPSSAPQIVKRTLGSCHLPLTDAVFTLEFTAYCPKALFSSSRVILGASDYIDILLGGSAFSESKEVDIDEPVDIQAGDYSYDADSDLESDDGYDDDARGSSNQRSQSSTSIKTRPRLGRVCVLKDIAYKTFKALLACSPKSMYRLADMINHEPLKKLALANLQTQLTKRTFFTSWYPEVLNMEVKFTVGSTGQIQVVQDNRKTMFKRLVDGHPLVVPRRRESPLPVVPPGQRRRNVIHISDWGVPPYLS
ncbi:hypothetical protein EV421DRAFT_1828537 [Armillaria borealis]|uniref:Uncharacterized protein n=1 Tax=Armillaria borealis TaxID=47425 RepID=A0AA39J9L9_9AGAR|nr:hypothetical protein EV421DRAFT_1828537 [Armillaria borealis]